MAAAEDLTFVFTDIEGSTSLAQQLGAEWRDLLAAHNDVLRSAIASHDGNEVRTEGDAFVITFTNPVDAVRCCLRAQLDLSMFEWPGSGSLRVRMGAHRCHVTSIGPAEHVGLDIHEAARIASTGHGGQIVLSERVVRDVQGLLDPAVGFDDLGLHGLKDFPESRRLYQLAHPDLERTFPPLRSLTAREHNLEVPTTPIIGRAAELAEVVQLLTGGARLVSILGEGGLGKTRFATEVARQLLSWSRDGVWFVPLAEVTEPDQVPYAIAQVLGLETEDRDAVGAIAGRIGEGRVLLVVDNLEHVLEASPVLTELLARCPDLKILATSRERLRIRGERRVELTPLTVPDGDDREAVVAADTGRLLLDHAERIGKEIRLDEATAPTVAQICRRLDGLPLAVELAAARLADYSLSEVADRLERSVDLLAEGDRDLPPRQRTLRSAIAWSEDLLTDEERSLFRACSVFAGSFDAAAAAAVSDTDATRASDAARRLAAAGLARAEEGPDGERRWHFLMPIRQYGADALEADGRTAEVRRRFVAEVVRRAEAVAPALKGPDQRDGLNRIAVDHPNVAAAFHHADAESLTRLGASLFRYYNVRGAWREGLDLLQRAATKGTGPPDLRARARIGFANLQRQLSDLDGAVATLARTEGLLGADDDEGRGLYHCLLGQTLHSQTPGDADSRHHLDLAERHAQRHTRLHSDPSIAIAVATTRLVVDHEVATDTRSSEDCRRVIAGADSLLRRFDDQLDPSRRFDIRHSMAWSHLFLGELAEAELIARDLTSPEEPLGLRTTTLARILLASVLLEQGRTDDAATIARAASDAAEALGDPYWRVLAAGVADDAIAAGPAPSVAERHHFARLGLAAARQLGLPDDAEVIQDVLAILTVAAREG